jgi:hypothetical protein
LKQGAGGGRAGSARDDAAARFLALATDLTPLGLLPQQGGD